MTRCNVVIFTVLFFHATFAVADVNRIDSDIGGLKFDLQAPNGFYEISSLSPEIKRHAESTVPLNNRLVAVFVSEEDLGAIMKAQQPKLARYMLIQVSRQFDNKNISMSQFQELANILRAEQDSLLKTVKENLDNFIGDPKKAAKRNISSNVRIGDVFPLGVFFEQSNAVGFAYLSKIYVEAGSKKNHYVLAGAASFIFIKGKVLYAYVYSNYTDQQDLAWVRSKSEEWVKTLLSLNETSLPTASKTSLVSGINWKTTTSKSIGGFLAGGAISLLMVLFYGVNRFIRSKRNASESK